MKLKRIELDIAGDVGWQNEKGEYTDTFDIERINTMLKKETSKHYVKFKCLQEVGPAGGNPLYEFVGSDEALRSYIKEFFCNSEFGEDVDFYMESAEDVDET